MRFSLYSNINYIKVVFSIDLNRMIESDNNQPRCKTITLLKPFTVKLHDPKKKKLEQSGTFNLDPLRKPTISNLAKMHNENQFPC